MGDDDEDNVYIDEDDDALNDDYDYDEEDDEEYDYDDETAESEDELYPEVPPVLSLEALKKVESHAFKGQTNSRCEYGFITTKDGTAQDGKNTHCHAAMGYPEMYSKTRPLGVYNVLWGNSTYGVKGNNDFGTAYGPCRSDVPIHPVFLQWLHDKVQSPYRALLQKGFHTFTLPNHSTVQVISDLDHSSQLLTSFCKAGRMYTEAQSHGLVFNLLVDKGVHPALAFIFAQSFYVTDKKDEDLTWQPSWHGGVFENPTMEVLKNFIAGNPVDDVNYGIFGKGVYAYGGVDAIWGGGSRYNPKGHDFKAEFEKRFNITGKDSTSRFSGTVTTPGWSITNVVNICQQLEKELGLDPFTPTK